MLSITRFTLLPLVLAFCSLLWQSHCRKPSAEKVGLSSERLAREDSKYKPHLPRISKYPNWDFFASECLNDRICGRGWSMSE